jgi:DNA-binding transcriptional LysR family regulator
MRDLDLNLIRVLKALSEEGSVTKAGARLGLSQSAVSHALNKMRIAFNDQLFIRGPDGMHPTPRAAELSKLLGGALRQIDAAVGESTFEPATAALEIVVATSDYITSTVFPSVLQAIEGTAPGVRIWLRPLNDVNIVEELDRGTVQVAVGAFGKVPSRFVKKELFSDRNVWMFRAGHPAANISMTLEVLAAYPHVDILIARRDAGISSALVDQSGLERAYVTSNPQYLDGLLAEVGLERHVGATLSHILAVPPLLAAGDMIAYVPSRFARFAERTFGMTWKEAPYVAPPMTISGLVHRTMGGHASTAWIMGLLQASAGLENGMFPHLP